MAGELTHFARAALAATAEKVLTQVLRQEMGAVYTPSVSYYDDCGYQMAYNLQKPMFYVNFSTSPEDAERCKIGK